jgi:cytochrome P450
VHHEVCEVVGDGPIRFDHVPALEYTGRVIQEALRRYSGWFNVQRAETEVTLGAVHLPAGTIVGFSPHMLHHDPRVFADPERFDPDRWSPEREGESAGPTFLPFSTGRRKCPGKAFGLAETTIQLATIVRHWRLDPAPETSVERTIRGVTVVPSELPLIVRARTG